MDMRTYNKHYRQLARTQKHQLIPDPLPPLLGTAHLWRRWHDRVDDAIVRQLRPRPVPGLLT